ncbi:MAG: MHO_4530 family protein [Metamycoplasmataceae bacterium]
MDNVIVTIMVTIFAILLISLCVLFVIVEISQKKNALKSNSGIFLVDIDLKNNRLRKYDLIQMIDIDSTKKNDDEYFSEGWMDINEFLNNLTADNKEKFLTALDDIKINKKYVKFIIKNETTPESDYSIEWVVEFFQTNNEINSTIKWSYVKKLPKGLRIITKEDLFENKNSYKSFIAFNLRSKDHLTFKEFVTILFENLKMKNLDFFISRNIVILIVYGENSEIVQTEIKKIVERFEKIKSSKNLDAYCDSIAVVESKNLFNQKDLLKVMNRIYFSLIKSSQLEKIFYFSTKNIFFNEFEEFKENYSLLNDMIKNKNIGSVEIPIKDYKNNNNVIAKYMKPKIDYPVNFWTEKILEKDNILPSIEDEYFEFKLNSFKKMDQYLIDVNDYVILQNIDQIKEYKSIVFIVKFLESTNLQNFELIALTLKSNGIKFGIKINSIVPEVITIIESIMPQAIIISESLIDTTDLNKYLLLKQLLTLCAKNPATLIYENPSEFELSNNKIINYYYKDK